MRVALQHEEVKVPSQLITGRTFDIIFLALTLLFSTGQFCDAWAHNNIPHLETFFTPWHGVLYSGLLFLVIGLTAVIIINHHRGAPWLETLPKGYELTALGVYSMILVGFGDMTWHLIFGIEQNIDAIFSPTHLLGMVCSALVAAGPYRALYYRQGDIQTLKDRLVLAGAFVLFLVTIVNASQSASIFGTTWPSVTAVGNDTGQLLGISSFLLQAILFTGLTLYTIRRWTLAPGFFTITLTVVAIPLSLMRQYYFLILVSLIAGIILDAVYTWLKPSTSRVLQFRTFAAFAAATLYVVYLLYLVAIGKVIWTVHMTTGSILVVAIIGAFLSYLALPGTPPATTSDSATN